MSIMHWIGIDDHADKLTIAHFEGDGERPSKEFELVPNARGRGRLLSFLRGLDGEVRIVYEAGPCGFDLYRQLVAAGFDCRVAAPSLTPKKPGEKVKTNRRDAAKLGRYLRSGNLTFVSVPDERREALRDLLRQRASVQRDVGRTKKQIIHLLLRYGHRYRDGNHWTDRFWGWLRALKLGAEHSQFVLEDLIIELEHRMDQLRRYDERIAVVAQSDEYRIYVEALSTLRGINTLSAMTILSELGDLRRFPTAPELMSAVGLIPGESSTGEKTTRLSITKAGNAHVRHVVVEAAWHYRRGPRVGKGVRARRAKQPPEIVAIAEKCDHRLSKKFYRLTSRGKKSTITAVAVARELVGFIWAIGQKVHP
jgi:transposase